MNQNFVEQIIAKKTHCFFVSPHLDDAIFSAGGLISKLAGKTRITIINVFTSCGNTKNTLSAKAYLKQCGYESKEKLFLDRNNEDSAVFKKLGVEVINLGEVDALWRQKSGLVSKLFSSVLPEFGNVYPTYRFHICLGKVSDQDKSLIEQLASKIVSFLPKEKYLLFSPVGIGNHVDHLVVREACLRSASGKQIFFWADFPYLVRSRDTIKFFKNNSLIEHQVKIDKIQKKEACKMYVSQFASVIKNESQILDKESFYHLSKNIFPEKIGQFSFKKMFQAEDDMSNYSFAIYHDNKGKEYFVKRYYGPKNTRPYKFLKNEINVYKFLSKSQNSEIIIYPKLSLTQESDMDLFMVIEFINGSTLKNLSPKEKVEVIEKVIASFSCQNLKLISSKQPILYRGPSYWVVILFAATLQNILKNPKYSITIFKSFIIALKGLPELVLRKQRGLIHRDFNDHNVIVKKGKMYPIDFQLTSIADPLIERAILYLKYYNDPKMISEITKTSASKSIAADKKQHLVLITYQIIFALYDQCLSDGDHQTTAKFLDNLVSNNL